MARAGKVGIDYFSHDTDVMSDSKIRFIKAKHGLLGYAVFFRLLENIYSENGYFVKVDEKFNILFADENKIDLNVYILILNDCINEGLFNKELYLKHKILTSKRIQVNYIAATERRKSVEVIKEYLLINVNEYKNSSSKCGINILNLNDNILDLNDNILELNTYKSTQKEKEKEKEREKENNKNKNTPAEVVDDLTGLDKAMIDFDKFWEMYDKKVGKDSCLKIWSKLKTEEKELIFEKLPAYIKSQTDKQYRKNPKTWLNGKCWNDEIIAGGKNGNSKNNDGDNSGDRKQGGSKYDDLGMFG